MKSIITTRQLELNRIRVTNGNMRLQQVFSLENQKEIDLEEKSYGTFKYKLRMYFIAVAISCQVLFLRLFHYQFPVLIVSLISILRPSVTE